MTQVHSMALDRTISVNRIINKIEGNPNGPTIVFFAGIHGNEPAGVLALEQELKKLEKSKHLIEGTIYGICGNLKALEAKRRFIEEDLNRIWEANHLNSLDRKHNLNPEEQEQVDLFGLLQDILNTEKAPFYFIDLHTTSSKTIPFITINDATINRKFSGLFPVPIVLGIEEHLNGPLLSYINELGYVSLGFESGQHDEKEAVENAIAFIHLALLFAGNTSTTHFPEQYIYFDQLKKASEGLRDVFEVIDLYSITKNENFEMQPGFRSFQNIEKEVVLATSNLMPIQANYSGRIFMPLYQREGKEGFFIIKKIKPIYLKISLLIRNLKLDNLLSFFPGINWENSDKTALVADLKVTKFLVKPIFHLLGYRNRQINKDHIRLHNRERASKMDMYKNQFWFKGY